MNWIAPSAKDPLTDTLEQRLWASADQFRANSGLKAQEYSGPILGIIFLRFAEGRFGIQRARLETAASSYRRGSRINEPASYHADSILYLACGSGGMFVSSARFVSEHKKNPSAELSIHGVEKTDETGRLARMNLAVHGLEGDIRHGGQVNSYYDDPHKATGLFDFVLANPPFNVNAVDKERLADAVGPGRRFPFGLPRTDNANYLWIQLFHSSLNARGRAGFVMANSASDARSSEQEIRQKLIESRAVDVMVAVGTNMFYTVTLPCTLWFFDKGKAPTPRKDTVLFIDARHIYRQVDRAHRDWTAAQIGFLSNLVRLYRGEALDHTLGGSETEARLQEVFGQQPRYADVPGLCRAATLPEIEAQGCSLNPGRYVGVAPGEAVSDEDFKQQLQTLNEELEILNAQAHDLEQTIARNVAEILEA
jgi:type I restriction enzyme M protein